MEVKEIHKQMAEKVKSTYLTVCYGEWLHTQIKEWGDKTPYQIIREGNGDELIDVLNQAGNHFKKGRKDVRS
jgi:hypothetical protein